MGLISGLNSDNFCSALKSLFFLSQEVLMKFCYKFLMCLALSAAHQSPGKTFPQQHTNTCTHISHPSKCHSLHRCQGFRGTAINITSFLSIRAYLFPSSYCTSASDPICILGNSPDESRPPREGKTEWEKDEAREGEMRGENKRGTRIGGRAREQKTRERARSFKIHGVDEIWWCLTSGYYRWKWIQDSALSQMVNMPRSVEA